jgi:hypothetical protein
VVVAGLDTGEVWAANVRTGQRADVTTGAGAPITALAVAGECIAWGDEAGGAGIEDVPAGVR